MIFHVNLNERSILFVLKQNYSLSMKVLMVCLGNICRSPLAEGILQHKIESRSLPWEVDSAGTGSWHTGQQPDARSIATARKHGIDITRQRARQIKNWDLSQYDLILTMDSQNYQDVMRLAIGEQQQEKIRLIMNYAFPGQNRSVPDPYWNDDGFEQVFEMLDQACEALIREHGNC